MIVFDGDRRMVSSGVNNNTIRIWDLGKQLPDDMDM
jgi:hypothetical protein